MTFESHPLTRCAEKIPRRNKKIHRHRPQRQKEALSATGPRPECFCGVLPPWCQPQGKTKATTPKPTTVVGKHANQEHSTKQLPASSEVPAPSCDPPRQVGLPNAPNCMPRHQPRRPENGDTWRTSSGCDDRCATTGSAVGGRRRRRLQSNRTAALALANWSSRASPGPSRLPHLPG